MIKSPVLKDTKHAPKNETRAIIIATIGLTLLAFQNCSGVDFSTVAANSTSTQTVGGGGGPTNTCTPQMATNLRVILMVDDSGSTLSDDPGAQVRAQSALAFIKANSGDANLTYNYSYFASVQGSYDFATGSFTQDTYPKTAFGTAAQAETAVNAFLNVYQKLPENGTDYQDALAYIQNVVTEDEKANPGVYSYAIVFMSDGQPNRGDTTALALEGDVITLLTAAGSSRLSLSTLYFNDASNADQGEADIMADMAAAGMGQYVNTVTNSGTLNVNSMIQGVITVPTNACTK